ncbi:MAG TPA: MFS transporter, partial [Hyphomicrobiaceae bacterium]|nr:MFS transporter [Hyphomicrobiaceae bacterium]
MTAADELRLSTSGATERRTFAAAAAAHVVHDGYTDLLYVLLPVWQAEFGLGYAEVGMLRGSYMASMSALQIPSSLLAERVSPIVILVGGTLLAAACFLLAGVSVGLTGLLMALLLGGVGASVQHPIAAGLVSSAFDGVRSRTALGVYNFCGDIGKMALPALTALLLTFMPWRAALWIVAAIGIVLAVLVLLMAPRTVPASAPAPASVARVASDAQRVSTSYGFRLLFAISLIDSAARMGFLTFLPFLLQAKGAAIGQIGLGLTLVFAGGAAGKLVCGYLGARLGVLATVILTEGLTAAGILALLPLPLEPAFVLLPAIGIGLNGTSSVLYGTVPELVSREARTRAFGIFYTGTAGASALAPPIMGLFGDRFGVPSTLAGIA